MSKKLHQSLGDWRAAATDVKSRIYAETIHQEPTKKRKPFVMKFAAVTAILAASITGIVFFVKDSPSPQTPVQSIEQPGVTEEANIVEFRTIHENYLAIAQYELFYRSNMFYTVKGVQFHALSDALDKYTLINYLASYNYAWSEKEEETALKMIDMKLEAEFKQPITAAYYEKMFRDLSITKEEYIRDYLLVNKEYDAIQYVYSTKNIIKEDDTSSEQTKEELMNRSGISYDYLEYLAMRIESHLQPLDPQPQLSFLKTAADEYTYLKVAKNIDGDYIFTDPTVTIIDLPDALSTYIHNIRYEVNGTYDDFFTRMNYENVKAIIQEDAQQGLETAIAMLDFLDVFERTVDWDYIPEPYAFNDIPTFDLATFRQHDERTLQIQEHINFYRSTDNLERYIAYRKANISIVEMYALFNYLAQDFHIQTTNQKRAQYIATAKQQLEELLEDPIEAAYFEQLLADLSITADDYIEQYSSLLLEYEALQTYMEKEKVGLDETGRYPSGEQASRYRETSGLTYKALYKDIEDQYKAVQLTHLDPQPDVPFEMNKDFPMEFYKNKDGELVVTSLFFFELYLTDAQKEVYETIKTKLGGHELARYTVDEYLKEAAKYNTPPAQEFVAILNIFKTSLKEYE